MPPETALHASDKFRAALLAKERAAAVRLVNAYGALYKRLQTQISALSAEIDLMDKAGTLRPWKVGKLARLKSLQRQVTEEIDRFAAVVENEVEQGARAAIAQAQADAKALVQAALPGVAPIDAAIMTQWQALNPAAVETLLGYLQPDSALMQGLRTKFGAEIADSIGRKLVEGIGLGYNPRKVASIIEQEMGMGLTSALRVSRTAQLYAYREASRAAYLANPEVVTGWTWRSARDGRSCAACIAMDGTHHKATETLNGHWQCRCTMLPDVVDYADIGLDVPRRAASNPLPTGEEWLKAQPKPVQRAMLGPAKYKLWQSGNINISDLATEHDDPVWGPMTVERTLKELVA